MEYKRFVVYTVIMSTIALERTELRKKVGLSLWYTFMKDKYGITLFESAMNNGSIFVWHLYNFSLSYSFFSCTDLVHDSKKEWRNLWTYLKSVFVWHSSEYKQKTDRTNWLRCSKDQELDWNTSWIPSTENGRIHQDSQKTLPPKISLIFWPAMIFNAEKFFPLSQSFKTVESRCDGLKG